MNLRRLFKSMFAGEILVVATCIACAASAALLFRAHHRNLAYDKLKDTHDLNHRTDQLASKYIAKRPGVGLIVAVSQHGKRYLRGFGSISAAKPSAPDAQTLFEIGSVTKVFTAAVLAKLAEAGTVKLDDPISLYLPKGVTSPTRNGREITLLNLATHTSGLPRLPGNLFATTKDMQNPYAEYHAKELYADISKAKLASEPGKKSSYSNYGFGLLGHLLELKTGQPYEALVRETFCSQLAMTNTVIELSAEQTKRLAQGHNSKGKPVPGWDLAVLAGCGGFRSTAADMLQFVEANLHTTNTALAKIFGETQKVHFKGLIQGVGLGWQIEILDDPVLYWHNGGTGGYRSFIGLDKTNDCGVVVLASSEDGVDDMAMDILKSSSKISLE